MKLNKNLNKKKLNKTNKTHIYDYMFTLFMNGSKLKSRRKNLTNASYTSQMQQKISSFKKKVFFNWVPRKKLHQSTAAEHERVTNQ